MNPQDFLTCLALATMGSALWLTTFGLLATIDAQIQQSRTQRRQAILNEQVEFLMDAPYPALLATAKRLGLKIPNRKKATLARAIAHYQLT